MRGEAGGQEGGLSTVLTVCPLHHALLLVPLHPRLPGATPRLSPHSPAALPLYWALLLSDLLQLGLYFSVTLGLAQLGGEAG